MKVYMVNIAITSVVLAEDEEHALEVADRYSQEAMRDDSCPQINVLREIKSLGDLTDFWDGYCIPYGGDGNTQLSELLPETRGDTEG